MKVNIKHRITSRYKDVDAIRNNKPHTGIDFKFETGEPLYTIKSGTVVKLSEGTNLGKGVFVQWEDGRVSIYGHLSKFANIKVGDKLQAGDLIGFAGSTGRSTGVHLHFSVKENGHFIDPSPWVDHIQNMDKLGAIVEKATAPDNIFTIRNIFNQQNSVHLDLLKLFKANFIPLVKEAKLSVLSFVTNNAILNQYFEYLMQFFF